MDQQTFLEIATVVSKLKMYPYFDVASHILMCLIVRDDNPPQTSGKKNRNFHVDSWSRPQNLLSRFCWLGPKYGQKVGAGAGLNRARYARAMYFSNALVPGASMHNVMLRILATVRSDKIYAGGISVFMDVQNMPLSIVLQWTSVTEVTCTGLSWGHDSSKQQPIATCQLCLRVVRVS